MFLVTIFKSRKDRSIFNIKEFTTAEDYDTALNIASEYPGNPYRIVEAISEELDVDFDSVESSDNDIEKNVTYWVCSDSDNWDDYHWPLDTLAEAKASAKKCFEQEHCRVYIEKHFEKVWREI